MKYNLGLYRNGCLFRLQTKLLRVAYYIGCLGMRYYMQIFVEVSHCEVVNSDHRCLH
jgi:hypothetical protein